MRTLSAFISVFVFASVALEHPKHFARAQAMAIGSWAGVRRWSENLGFFRVVGGAFQIPDEFRGRPGSAAFFGVTLGSDRLDLSRDCLSIGSIAIGVMVTLDDLGDPHYTHVYQSFPDTLTTSDPPRPISSGDRMFAFVLAQHPGIRSVPLAVLMNQTEGWSWSVTLKERVWHRSGWSVCSASGGWKVGYIVNLDTSSYLFLANFGEVIFHPAVVIDSVFGIIEAGARGHVIRRLLDADGRLLVDTVIDNDDPSIIRFRHAVPAL